MCSTFKASDRKPCERLYNSTTGSTRCDLCVYGAYKLLFDNGRIGCFEQCPPKFYNDDSSMECKRCADVSCMSCFAKGTLCSECDKGTMLLDGACVALCPEKHCNDTSVCVPCNPKCKSCKYNPNHCTEGCESPFIFHDHKCVVNCDKGFAEVGGYCVKCEDEYSTECATFNQSMSTRCMTGIHLYQGRCHEVCPSGTFANNGVCDKCPERCKTCFHRESCLTCNSAKGYVMYQDNNCKLLACPYGTYLAVSEIEKPRCEKCDEACLECKGSSADDCVSCNTGYMQVGSPKNDTVSCKKCGELLHGTEWSKEKGCVEICGDGVNLGLVECDDGNRMNGDGCSSECKIEPGYACLRGANGKQDHCYPKIPPRARLLVESVNKRAIIIFSRSIAYNKATSILFIVKPFYSERDARVNKGEVYKHAGNVPSPWCGTVRTAEPRRFFNPLYCFVNKLHSQRQRGVFASSIHQSLLICRCKWGANDTGTGQGSTKKKLLD
eukprot:TRINITY_DN442_c0_g1_i4.p1 TRINITY_DN442_c0_g1~~TRINITY_DN442_c0_g1_i4.p1  ORF type:complete len:495 (+),score=8.09 TRINITY_DN442_c0_g1_i4:1300-2784(+)